jgi:hypothetical protein
LITKNQPSRNRHSGHIGTVAAPSGFFEFPVSKEFHASSGEIPVQRRDNRETCILTNVREHLQEHKRPAGGGDGADLLAVNPLGRAPRTRLFRQSLPGLLRRGWPTWQPALSTFEVSPHRI